MNAHRIDLICRLIQGLLIRRSANLMQVATAMPGPAKKMSRYRRLQRFSSSGLSPQILSQLIVPRLLRPDRMSLLTVTMDRTQWKWGQTHENILCLGVVFEGVSIPLESMALGKAGNSHTSERRALFERAWEYLKDYPCCRLADREFIGAEGFRFLLDQKGLDFVIRIRENRWVTLPDGRQRELGMLVRTLPKGPTWSIETAFSYLKRKGFDLEATHLTHPQRISLLMAILSVCLLWCVLVGLEQHRKKPIPLKKHGRRAISLLRLGLDSLQEPILHFETQWRDFRHYCRLLLSCT